MGKNSFFILAGGGSGGHLYPGLAVAEALRQITPGVEVLFVCTQREIDRVVLGQSDWRYEAQPIVPLPSRPGEVWRFWQSWRASVRMCERLMRKRRPRAVLGLGGFAAGPAMKVAAKLAVPVGMLNPDAVPGKANKYCKKYADKIFLQWDVTAKYFSGYADKCVVCGCPIRKGFEQRKRDENNKTLVVVGGSLGGHNVNTAVVKCLSRLGT